MTDAEQPDTFPDDQTADGPNRAVGTDGATNPAAQAPARSGDAEAVEALRGLVRYVVENLVDHPEQAEIIVEQRGNVVALGVRLPEEELGKVIGRGGRIAKSIRTALMVAGSQHHLRVSLDIDASDSPEPEDADSETVTPTSDEPDS